MSKVERLKLKDKESAAMKMAALFVIGKVGH